MKINNKQLFTIPLATMLIIAGCGIPKKVEKKQLTDVPAAYMTSSSTDNMSIAQLSFKEYFTDTHLLVLIEDVLAHNFSHKIAGQQMKIAEAYLRNSKGALLPRINGEILASGTRYGKHTIDGVGNFDTNLSPNIEESQKINTAFSPNYWLGLNASWELDIWGKLRSLKRSAQARYLATEEGRNLLKSALVTQTAILYYELVTLDKEQEILNENIALQQKALDIIRLHKEVGRATELAVQQFNAQLSNTKATLTEVEQQVIATENQLLALSGKYEGRISRSEKVSIDGINYLTRHGQPRHLLEFRPDIKGRFQELEATHADAQAARASFFPTVNVSAFVGVNSFNADYLFNPTAIVYQLLGNAVAPIFQQHQLKSNFNISTARQEIAFLDYQNTIVNAFHEVKTLISYIDKNSSIIHHKEEEVKALDRGVKVSNDLYVTAYASYLEIISAQKSKIEADLALIQAERNQVHALIQLYKALGGGWTL